MSDLAIQVERLGKLYRIGLPKRHDTLRDQITDAALSPLRRFSRRSRRVTRDDGSDHVWALRDVSFDVKPGEVVGIIGRNGSGKSTLLKVLTRITEPTEGYAEIRGRVGSLLEVGTGFHPELTGRENVYLNGAILGMNKAEIQRKFDEILAFAEIEKFIDTPVKHYSSGMYVRLAFAVAAHMEPEILLVDEVLAVGDYSFQKKCLGKMGDIGQGGRTVVLVSHNLPSIVNLCSRAILLNAGRIVVDGWAADVVQQYLALGSQTSGEVIWPDPTQAPGDQKIRLHAVRILPQDGRVSPDLDMQQEIVLEISYWVMHAGVSPVVSIIVKSGTGERVLASVSLPSENLLHDSLFGTPFPAGLFRTECHFPPGLFNTMSYSVDVHLGSSISTLSVALADVVSFTVHDLKGRDTSGIRWQGVVHPKLAWATEQVLERHGRWG